MDPVLGCKVCGRENEKHGYVKGMCRRCYQRVKKTGRTTLVSAEERFMAKVQKSDTCWLWTAYLNPAGYGQFGYEGKVVLAHRWSYEHHSGERIPDGMTVDHLCRNPACVNPGHLDVVSLQENLSRTTGFRFTHYARGDRDYCGNGHELTIENRYKRPGRVNSYACRTCMREYARAYQRKARNSG